MTDQLITGTDVIRKALHAKNVKFNLSGLAKTCNVPTDTLEQFIAGRVTLLPNMLQTLTTELFAGNAIYDEKIDRLRPARQQEPTSMGTKPPPIDPKMLKSFKAGPAAAAPRPVVPVKPL